MYKSDHDDPHGKINKSDEDDPHQRFGVIKGGIEGGRKKESFEDHLKKHIETPISYKYKVTHTGGTDPDPKGWSGSDDPKPG